MQYLYKKVQVPNAEKTSYYTMQFIIFKIQQLIGYLYTNTLNVIL